MSAYFAIRADDAVHLFTDAAWYDETETLTKIETKVIEFPDLNLVATGRGELGIVAMLAGSMARGAKTFDEVIERAPRVLAEAEASLPAIYGETASAWELLICGWSESRERPEMHIALGYRSPMPGMEPWQLYEWMADVIGAPDIPAETVDMDIDAMLARAPDALGLAVLSIMRDTPQPNYSLGPDAPSGHWIGGFAEHSTVSRDGIRRAVLHEWPDEVGRKIEPERCHEPS